MLEELLLKDMSPGRGHGSNMSSHAGRVRRLKVPSQTNGFEKRDSNPNSAGAAPTGLLGLHPGAFLQPLAFEPQRPRKDARSPVQQLSQQPYVKRD